MLVLLAVKYFLIPGYQMLIFLSDASGIVHRSFLAIMDSESQLFFFLGKSTSAHNKVVVLA